MFAFEGHYSNSFFTWEGSPLEELVHPFRYMAEVQWPNGETETLEMIISTQYDGYNDDKRQECFLLINHKGKVGYFELMGHQPEDWAMVTKLEKVKYA